MSEPHSSSESATDGDAEHERSSGEELLEEEERVKEADRRERAERAERSGDPEAEAEAEAEDDAEDVESEWHAWAFGALVVAGIALFLAPRFLLPELLGGLGLFLVAIGVFGWVLKWAIDRSA